MKVNEMVMTPRFCTVRIKEIFNDRQSATEAGYTEPTHYYKNGWTILGKSTGLNRMCFAGVKDN